MANCLFNASHSWLRILCFRNFSTPSIGQRPHMDTSSSHLNTTSTLERLLSVGALSIAAASAALISAFLMLQGYSSFKTRQSAATLPAGVSIEASFRSQLRQDISCGPACLVHLIHVHGWVNWANTLPSPACPRPHGWSMQDLVDSALAMRWTAVCVQTDWASLQNLLQADTMAAILHVNTNHFVLARRNSIGVWAIFDPKLPSAAIAEAECRSWYDWDGYAVIVSSAAIDTSDAALAERNH